ncbi:MAG TPA: ferritin-like domain-containing protein [Thermomicrobiales bacterium]|nr:ferritin-like domain-containing protein [Thermomicrobiales bacterium]
MLNYALTFEHLEAIFYREGLAAFTLDKMGGQDVDDLLTVIGQHEAAHAEALTGTISELGGAPVEEATYDFGYTDVASFLATAAAVENIGVAAYAGAAPSVAVLAPGLVPTALGIHSVEARHASFVAALINDEENQPFPNAVGAPLTPDEVPEIAGPFIVSGAASTPEPSELTVAVGTTVTWINQGAHPHNAAADDGTFVTEYVTNGESVSVTMTEPGTSPLFLHAPRLADAGADHRH